jgi:hypothetical protein
LSLLSKYITMHGPQNVKFTNSTILPCIPEKQYTTTSVVYYRLTTMQVGWYFIYKVPICIIQ